jgi:serine/threonine protein kinase
MTAEIHLMGQYQGPGEKKTVETLAKELPNGWHILANRKLSGEQRDDLDIVIVGYSCVFVVEEKAWGPRVVAEDHIWKTSRRDYVNPLDRIAHLSRLVASRLRNNVQNYKEEVYRRHAVVPAVILSHDRIILERGTTLAQSELVLALVDGIASRKLIERDNRDKQSAFSEALRRSILEDLSAIPTQDAKPTRIGEYNILDELAPVGLARAFLAETANGRPVMLRCYPTAGWGPNIDMTEALRREAKVLAKLEDSDRALRTFDDFEDDVHGFWVTPILLTNQNRSLLRSDQLSEHRTSEHSIPDSIIDQVISDAFFALAEVHKEGILHRALHPSRVLIGRQMRIRFKDFFLSRLDTGKTIGQHWSFFDADCSVPYRAPEVMSDYQFADQKSDVYSLALSIAVWVLGNIPEFPEVDLVRTSLAESDSAWAKFLVSCLDSDASMRPKAEDCGRLNSNVDNQPANESTSSVFTFEPGSVFHERYTILSPLGQGGFAKAWRAHDLNRMGDVVLKVFKEGTSESAAREEFNAAQRVHSNRCARVLDIMTKPSPGVLVCEFAPGEDLLAFSRQDSIDAENFRRISLDILEALEAVHSQEMVHRDISPSNIIVDSENNGHAKLIDFGLCVSEGQGNRAGTPRYMAPECLAGSPSTPSSDIYGLAASVLHAMLGRLPYSDDIHRRPIPATPDEATTWGKIGAGIIAALFDALAKDPTQRLSSAKHLREQIEMVADIKEDIDLVEATNPTVDSLRRIYRFGEIGNAGTKGLDDAFAHDTYVPTALDESLLPQILEGQFKVLLLTGNPGDGKTSYLVKVKDALLANGATQISPADDSSGWEISLNGRVFKAIYDASESYGGMSSDARLDKVIQPAIASAGSPVTALIAINDGRLIQYFNERLFEFGDVASNFVRQLRGDPPLSNDLLLVDLKRRALVSEHDDAGLGIQILNSLTEVSRWSICDSCVSKDVCPIRKNAESLRGDASHGVSKLIKVSHLRRRRRATFRDIRSAIAWIVTGNRSCADVHEARTRGLDLSRAKNSLYFDLAFSTETDDFLIQEWSEIDPARVPAPAVLRETRGNGVLANLDGVDEINATKSTLRRIFFGVHDSPMFEPRDVMMYEHLETFEQALLNPNSESLELFLLGISRLVGAIGYYSKGLAIASSEKGADWVVLKTVDSESFSLRQPHFQGSFVENFPDSLILSHKDGASLMITLDTAEIILRAGEGEILNDPYSESIRKEIEGFTAQVRRQPTREALIVDPIGVVTIATQSNNKISLKGGKL